MLLTVPALADGVGPIVRGVPAANPRVGSPPNIISPDFTARPVARGTDRLENPSGLITYFGFFNDGAIRNPSADHPPASGSEPDQNTYLTLTYNPGGPAIAFDYGRHFLYQGHEGGSDLGYVTRINLDINDPEHRITLLTPVGPDGLTHLNSLDGSAYDPFTKTLLVTSEESSPAGGVYQLSLRWPATLTKLDGFFGSAGYEGVHLDALGNIYLADDEGGTKVPVNPNDPSSPKAARQPNGFMYRFIPYDAADLTKGGKLQALQVSVDGAPITFHAADPGGDIFSTAQLKLHTPGTSYPITWVTVNDTGMLPSGSVPAAFDANAAAKTAGATPFLRPENLAFQPGSNFRTFYFTPTGDTNSDAGTPDLAARGHWGSIMRVDLSKDGATGKIGVFVLGDAAHSSFDNIQFLDSDTVLAAEDRGDGLHGQLNLLDSIWAYPITGAPGLRFLAQGRDSMATYKAETEGEGDNEPTGVTVSNGRSTVAGMMGNRANLSYARGFFTNQHGQNTVFEFFNKSN